MSMTRPLSGPHASCRVKRHALGQAAGARSATASHMTAAAGFAAAPTSGPARTGGSPREHATRGATFAQPESGHAAAHLNCLDLKGNLGPAAAPEPTMGTTASSQRAGLPSCNETWRSFGTSVPASEPCLRQPCDRHPDGHGTDDEGMRVSCSIRSRRAGFS